MLDINYFSELESSWHRIKNCGKPVFVYGMGDGCQKFLDLCSLKGICIDGIFASDDFVRGQDFCGYKVLKLSDIETRYNDFLVVLAFGTNLSEIMERIDDISDRYELIAPDMSVIGKDAFEKEKFLDDFDKVQTAYNLLSDEKSKEIFENLSAYKITGKLEYLKKIFSDENEGFKLLEIGNDEIYCDLGAYNGDTIEQFYRYTNGKYQKIYAVEPDKRNFQKCVHNCISFGNTEFFNCAVWKNDGIMPFEGKSGRQAQISLNGEKFVMTRSLDSILDGKKCTFIKYDVEGADFQALEGSEKTISRFAPKISCSVYHHPFDYIDIPIYLNRIYGNYKYYLRQSSYYPAWETNLFAINRG